MAEKKYRIRPTVTKGAAKVPVVMQLEALECGAASLAYEPGITAGFDGKFREESL